MFENRTYETILNRMLSQVKAQCGQIDTREGSIIYGCSGSGGGRASEPLY